MFENFERAAIDTGEATIRVCGADGVRGRALDCGHFLAEEAPDEVYEELRAFLMRDAL